MLTLLTIVNYRLQMPNIACDAYFTYSTEITLSLSATLLTIHNLVLFCYL